MYKKWILTSIAISSVAILSGCSEPDNGLDIDISQSYSLKPLAVHEECFEIKKGQAFDYEFEIEQPVLFNIHYHKENDEVVYPLSEQPMAANAGSVTAESDENYCLMWRNNNSESITLNYSIN